MDIPLDVTINDRRRSRSCTVLLRYVLFLKFTYESVLEDPLSGIYSAAALGVFELRLAINEPQAEERASGPSRGNSPETDRDGPPARGDVEADSGILSSYSDLAE